MKQEAQTQLVERMAYMSVDLGDPELWQKQSAKMLQMAAIDLFGLPKAVNEDAIRAANDAGRKAAFAERQAKEAAKPGLAAGTPVTKNQPPVLSAEDEIMQGISNAVAGKGNSPFSVAGDVIAPFVKTPVNVIKVGLEYSPIGMLEAIAKAVYGPNSIKSLRAGGESSLALQRQCAELFGRGAVGTGLLFRGSILKMAGIATGDDDKNEKARAWAKAQGQKGSFSIVANVGNHPA